MSHFNGGLIMFRKFNVTETINNTVRNNGGKPFGEIFYTFSAPTHWGSEGICYIIERYSYGELPQVTLHWSSGGKNADVTDIEVAYTMSKAFELAKNRLIAIGIDAGESIKYKLANNELPLSI